MTTWGTAAVIGWGVCALAVFRPLFRGLMCDHRNDWGDVSFGLVISAIVAGMGGPLVILFFALRRAVAPHDPDEFIRRIGGESSEQKSERLESERKDRERYIERLERELGIGDPA